MNACYLRPTSRPRKTTLWNDSFLSDDEDYWTHPVSKSTNEESTTNPKVQLCLVLDGEEKDRWFVLETNRSILTSMHELAIGRWNEQADLKSRTGSSEHASDYVYVPHSRWPKQNDLKKRVSTPQRKFDSRTEYGLFRWCCCCKRLFTRRWHVCTADRPHQRNERTETILLHAQLRNIWNRAKMCIDFPNFGAWHYSYWGSKANLSPLR